MHTIYYTNTQCVLTVCVISVYHNAYVVVGDVVVSIYVKVGGERVSNGVCVMVLCNPGIGKVAQRNSLGSRFVV